MLLLDRCEREKHKFYGLFHGVGRYPPKKLDQMKEIIQIHEDVVQEGGDEVGGEGRGRIEAVRVHDVDAGAPRFEAGKENEWKVVGKRQTRGPAKRTSSAKAKATLTDFNFQKASETARKRRAEEPIQSSSGTPPIEEQLRQLKDLVLKLLQQQQADSKDRERQTEALLKLQNDLKTAQADMKAAQGDLKTAQVDLKTAHEAQVVAQMETRAAYEKLEKMMRHIETETVRKTTYAAVAGSGTPPCTQVQADTSVRQAILPQSRSTRAEDDSQAIVINLNRYKGDKTDILGMKEKIMTSLEGYNTSRGLKVASLRPIPGDRVSVNFASEIDADKAREHTEWLNAALPEAKIKSEEWYPIKCDIVAKQAVLDTDKNDDRSLRTSICEDFKKDNSTQDLDCTAYKARWLSRPNNNKNMGSLVIWLKNRFTAEHMLSTGRAVFGAYGALCSRYVKDINDGPCYNCNTYGHMQSNCRKPTKCGICSQGHNTRDCTNKSTPKCPACAGSHAVYDRTKCPRHPRHRPYQVQSGTMMSPSQDTDMECFQSC